MSIENRGRAAVSLTLGRLDAPRPGFAISAGHPTARTLSAATADHMYGLATVKVSTRIVSWWLTNRDQSKDPRLELNGAQTGDPPVPQAIRASHPEFEALGQVANERLHLAYYVFLIRAKNVVVCMGQSNDPCGGVARLERLHLGFDFRVNPSLERRRN